MSFASHSLTICISAVATTKSLALVGCRRVRLTNTSTTLTAFVQFGAGSATAVIPTDDNATGTACVAVSPMQTVIADVPDGTTHVAAITTAAGPAKVYITPGNELFN